MRSALLLLLPLVAALGCAAAPTVVAEDPEGGFAIYRSGRLGREELKKLCAEGVEEIVVLDGSAEAFECALRDSVCPGLSVRYNRAQSPDEPVSGDFLTAFDAWVEESRLAGRRISFRCRRGWHRAGRLGAWYRLRFDGASIAEALSEMHRVGRMMALHPSLDAQVEAYGRLLAGEPCVEDRGSCPGAGPDPELVAGAFADDVCAAPGSG